MSIKTYILVFCAVILAAGCGKKEDSKRLTDADFDAKQTSHGKTDPAEEVNKQLEAVLQYYHSMEHPEQTPTKACYDAMSQLYFVKFPVDVTGSYKDDDGNLQKETYHYTGWNSIDEKQIKLVMVGNGSLTIASAPDRSKNVSVNLDGLPCLNFSQLTKVWDNQ